MAKDFMEKDSGGAAGKNGRAVEWLSNRCFAQRFKALAEIAYGRCENGLRGKSINRWSFEGLLAEKIHAIVGASDGDGDDPRLQVGRDDLRSFGRVEVVGLVLHGEKDHILVYVGVVAEDAGQFPHPLLPGGAVNDDGRSDAADVRLRGLLAEVGRGVFFLGADFGFGLNTKIVVERGAIAGVGGQPKRSRKGFAVVAERKRLAIDGRAAMRAVRVVELGIANADLNVGHARAAS